MRTPFEVAALIAATMTPADLDKANKLRARISEANVKELAQVPYVMTDRYVAELIDAAAMHGILMARLSRGGFCLIQISSLEGAPFIQVA